MNVPAHSLFERLGMLFRTGKTRNYGIGVLSGSAEVNAARTALERADFRPDDVVLQRAANHALATSGDLRAFLTESAAFCVDYDEMAGWGVLVSVFTDGVGDVGRAASVLSGRGARALARFSDWTFEELPA